MGKTPQQNSSYRLLISESSKDLTKLFTKLLPVKFIQFHGYTIRDSSSVSFFSLRVSVLTGSQMLFCVLSELTEVQDIRFLMVACLSMCLVQTILVNVLNGLDTLVYAGIWEPWPSLSLR